MNNDFTTSFEQIQEEDDLIITEDKLREYYDDVYNVNVPKKFFEDEFIPVDENNGMIQSGPEFNIFIITFMYQNIHTGEMFPRTYKGKYHVIPYFGGVFKITSRFGKQETFQVRNAINLGIVKYGIDKRD